MRKWADYAAVKDRRPDPEDWLGIGVSVQTVSIMHSRCPLRAGGLGLNLQEASYVFHLDRWWNPAVERQAEDRTHRMGQAVKVNVIKYSCTGTIEERIDSILTRKQHLFNQRLTTCR